MLELEQRRKDEGKKTHALDSLPAPIHILSDPFWKAFWRLHRCRTFDFNGNPNPIQFSDLKAHLDLFPTHDINRFVQLISVMDSKYLTQIFEKQEEKRTSESKNKNKKR